MLVAVAAGALDEDEHFVVLLLQRVDALLIGGDVMRAAIDENDAEFFHHPADERHAPQLLLGHDADHPLFRQREQDPDRVGHPGVIRAEHAAAGGDMRPPLHMKDGVPEKQADPRDPPADMIPESHPSFLLTSAKIASTDCSRV